MKRTLISNDLDSVQFSPPSPPSSVPNYLIFVYIMMNGNEFVVENEPLTAIHNDDVIM